VRIGTDLHRPQADEPRGIIRGAEAHRRERQIRLLRKPEFDAFGRMTYCAAGAGLRPD
jgi:hypothetical protein